jgi:hypothetical protein
MTDYMNSIAPRGPTTVGVRTQKSNTATTAENVLTALTAWKIEVSRHFV